MTRTGPATKVQRSHGETYEAGDAQVTHDGTDRAGTLRPSPLTGHIQRLLQRVRAADQRRPAVWDGLLTTFCILFAVLDVSSGGWRTVAVDPSMSPRLVLLLSAAFSAPLLLRRSHPSAVLLFMTPFALVNVWSGAVVRAAFLQEIVVFNIALRLPLRTLAGAGGIVLAPLLIGSARFPADWNQLFVPHLYAFVFVSLLGIVFRTRKEYTEALVDRANRLELERDQQAQLAAVAERTRIAREMHDIIGHNLSVITGLADGGAYAAAKSPERAAQALDAIGTTSRRGPRRTPPPARGPARSPGPRRPHPATDPRRPGHPARGRTDGRPPGTPEPPRYAAGRPTHRWTAVDGLPGGAGSPDQYAEARRRTLRPGGRGRPDLRGEGAGGRDHRQRNP